MQRPSEMKPPTPTRDRMPAPRSVALLLASGMGLALPALALYRAGAVRPAPYADGAVEPGPGDWHPGWTELAMEGARAQDAGLHALLGVLLALALLLLAMSCVNATALILAHLEARRHELVMRVVVGAWWRPLGRLLLLHAARPAVAAVGGAALLGATVLALAQRTWPEALPRSLGFQVDGPVVATALFLPPAILLLAGLLPLRIVRDVSLSRHLGVGARATAGRHEMILRRGVVVVSLAASVILAVGAGVLLRAGAPRSLPSMARPEGASTLTLEIRSRSGDPDPVARAAANAALLDELRALPGVVDSSVATPGAWYGMGTRDLIHYLYPPPPPGVVAPSGLVVPTVQHAVSRGFFASVGVPLLRGRDFTDRDGAGAPPVVVINETLAHRLRISRHPLGRKIQLGFGGFGEPWYTVVGVVRDARAAGVGLSPAPAPALYLSALQHPPRVMGVVVRTSPGDAAHVAARVDAAVRRMNGFQASPAVSLAARLESFAAPLRWFGALFAGLAGASLLLGAASLAALMSHWVALRTREIGVRTALGARPRDVMLLIVRESARVTRTGLLLGLAGAVCLARLLETLFQGVPLFDPAVYATVLLVLVGTGVAAALRPGLRAARCDPAAALRAE